MSRTYDPLSLAVTASLVKQFLQEILAGPDPPECRDWIAGDRDDLQSAPGVEPLDLRPFVDVVSAAQLGRDDRLPARGDGISIGFTSHYREMRRVFGQHLVDGIAGENVLVEAGARVDEAKIATGLVIESADGRRLQLDSLVPAEPCVEFSRFALGDPKLPPDDARLGTALAFLRHGMRGFYARYRGPALRLRVGDRVWLGSDRSSDR